MRPPRRVLARDSSAKAAEVSAGQEVGRGGPGRVVMTPATTSPQHDDSKKSRREADGGPTTFPGAHGCTDAASAAGCLDMAPKRVAITVAAGLILLAMVAVVSLSSGGDGPPTASSDTPAAGGRPPREEPETATADPEAQKAGLFRSLRWMEK